jgi:hypothetical protein
MHFRLRYFLMHEFRLSTDVNFSLLTLCIQTDSGIAFSKFSEAMHSLYKTIIILFS